MADKERITIEIRGLRDRVEAYKPGRLWKEASLGRKIRYLLEEALGIKDEKRLLRDFLRDLSRGYPLDEYSCAVLSEILEIEQDVIKRLKDGSAEQCSSKSEWSGLGSGRDSAAEGE